MKRVLLYILGLNLIAVAVVLNIRYGLGVAAFSSVMYSIQRSIRSPWARRLSYAI